MYIKVKITPHSKKEVVTRVGNDLYHISLKEKPEMNRANDRLLEIMRNIYPERSIRIISGHHSPSKIISIDERV